MADSDLLRAVTMGEAMMLVAVVTSTLSPILYGWLWPKPVQREDNNGDSDDTLSLASAVP